MKTFRLSPILLGIAVTVFFSCDREENNFGDAVQVTEEEALELVQTSLTSDAYGMNVQAEDALALNNGDTSKIKYECGVLNSKSMERSSAINAPVSFTHSIEYLFTLVCEEGQSKAFAIEFDGNGTYSSPRLQSDDTISYQAVLGNIVSSEGPYVYNSSFVREGTQTTRIASRTKNFDSTLSIESNAVAIDKDTRELLGGSATFSLQGTLGSGETFSYAGTITFKGNGAATININGNTYNVQI
ncbi:hypothetical protein [Costertonia aggregata]|uniref:Lipoprotein n=1 Tax=Costertonia aggregata TaxID=343403 RepID=A0A7H9APN4_9FLAO|nr:hypothetical protein [Costertonia aggregata]QLG45374.1 hypothetical protein HYG79_08445 [Costertonia aggregata]